MLLKLISTAHFVSVVTLKSSEAIELFRFGAVFGNPWSEFTTQEVANENGFQKVQREREKAASFLLF